jgi:hypothetical protein
VVLCLAVLERGRLSRLGLIRPKFSRSMPARI